MKPIQLALIFLFILESVTSCRKRAIEDGLVKTQAPEVDSLIGMENNDSLTRNKESYGSTDNFDFLLQEYEDPKRSDWQNPELVIKRIGTVSDMIVADIGAGSGYFTFKLASTAKKVIAIDIDERFLEYIEEKKSELNTKGGGGNIETRLSLEEDPLLKDNEVGVALIVNTYHFIDNRVAYLRKVRKGLKQGGRLVLVDFKIGDDIPIGPAEGFKISKETVSSEMHEAGFIHVSIDSVSLQYQYIIMAQ